MEMPTVVRIRKDCYRDSARLMALSEKVRGLSGVVEAAIVMATPRNKEMLLSQSLWDDKTNESGPNDLVISISATTSTIADNAMQQAILYIDQASSPENRFRTIESAMSTMTDANLILISVPGEFARDIALEALQKGVNVFLFSDNVPIDAELELKRLALQKGLLMMGPECGTAIINGVAMGFGNAVKRGRVGIVGAAGTGIQEVSTLLSRRGIGVSHAIGTGGRDLTEPVNGMMTVQAISILENDRDTDVIVVIAKASTGSVEKRILSLLEAGPKRGVFCLVGKDEVVTTRDCKKTRLVSTLQDAADAAEALQVGSETKQALKQSATEHMFSVAEREYEKQSPEQRYIRGLYSGGSLCHEASFIIGQMTGQKVANTLQAASHACVDFGKKEFTVGIPHPMIDLRSRVNALLDVAHDQSITVVLMDLVLGFGAHPDPGSILGASVRKAKKIALDQNRYLSVVASVCGTDGDPQGFRRQVELLEQEGVPVMDSNAEAARLACLIASRGVLAK